MFEEIRQDIDTFIDNQKEWSYNLVDPHPDYSMTSSNEHSFYDKEGLYRTPTGHAAVDIPASDNDSQSNKTTPAVRAPSARVAAIRANQLVAAQAKSRRRAADKGESSKQGAAN